MSDIQAGHDIQAGKRNLLTDIEGVRVGHAADASVRTGVSVIVPDKPAICAVACVGGGPGTRETDVLQPANLVQHIDAVVLAGGSVYGLDAASEIAALMGAAGRGFPTGAPLPSPVIPAAILFDLNNGGDKNWDAMPPYRALAREAYGALTHDFALGNCGAGYGAQAGALKGGLGSASVVMAAMPRVAALVAANGVGGACDEGGQFWAHYLAFDADAIPTAPPRAGNINPLAGSKMGRFIAGGNTSIGVVATDADLTRAEAQRVAIMAQDGLARAIRPIHTPFDGDTIFVLATGGVPLAREPAQRAGRLAVLGALAADCVSRAICRGIFYADDMGEVQSYRTYFKAQ